MQVDEFTWSDLATYRRTNSESVMNAQRQRNIRRHGGPAAKLQYASLWRNVDEIPIKDDDCCRKLKRKATLSFFRKSVYLLLCLFCFVWFVWEAIGFGKMYYAYPINVNVNVVFPKQTTLPALSICYNHPVLRSALCRIPGYSERCNYKNQSFPDLKNTIKFATMSDFQKFRQQPWTLIRDFNVTNFKNFNESSAHLKATWSHKGLYSCYTVYEQWTQAPLRIINTTSKLDYFAIVVMNGSETLGHVRARQGHVYIHSPYANPFEIDSRVRLMPGNFYELSADQNTILLLELPYKTACLNYTKAWLESGKKMEYLGRFNCLINCKQRMAREACGCLPAFHQVLTDKVIKDKCTSNYDHCYTRTLRANFTKCETEEICPNRCDIDTYDIRARRYDLKSVSELFDCVGLDCLTLISDQLSVVYLSVRTSRKLVYLHRPQFTPSEIFGYIGGYLGIWLGLSIPAVYKFVENHLFEIYYKCILKKRRDSIGSSIN